ncbi:protein mono-ADP-ribosyltransferase PARP12-like [Gastrophryne carolinensis]
MSDGSPLSLRLCKVLCSNGGSMEEGQWRGPEGDPGAVVGGDGSGARSNQACGGDCGNLHLCRFYILGGCSRPHCKFSHAIDTENALRLRRNHLEGVTVPELRFLLLQNDPALLPDGECEQGECEQGECEQGECEQGDCEQGECEQGECEQGECEQGECEQGDCEQGECEQGECEQGECEQGECEQGECEQGECEQGDCEQGECEQGECEQGDCEQGECEQGECEQGECEQGECEQGDCEQGECEQGECEQGECEQGGPSAPTSPGSPQPIQEICLYFILSSCSFKDRCVRDHYSLPYRWQLNTAGTWKDVSDMEAMERAYCDPNDRNLTSVNFDTMTFGSHAMRRLSTPSSASKPPHFLLTTDWLWYWKDEYGVWIEYGQAGGGNSPATMTSSDLESVFLSDQSANVQFKAGKQSYTLSFREMKQRNTRFGTERCVCRRPQFVSAEDVAHIKSRKSEPSKLQDRSSPGHWDKGLLPDIGYKLVALSSSSGEYKKISSMFSRTLPSTITIQSIERIQNQALWDVYLWQKEQMKKRRGREVTERQVFHGTSANLVDAICQQNFDWRICGAHGTAYGKGDYFARDASYSHNYCRSADSSQCTMFVARVLVGDSTRGSSTYLRPPAKPGSASSFYDSCVDSESDPSIFVIFEKHQIYPEYLIRYKERTATRR